jgi:hypothetical protein
VDCGYTGDWFMVYDRVWRAAQLGKRDFCCLACLERRLQRPLDLSDFPPFLVNSLAYAAAGKLCVVLEEHARSKREKVMRITSLSDADSLGWL